MSDEIQERVDQTLAFARYLSWADLLKTVLEAEMANEASASDADASREHEWRWFGLMCYWFSSLHVVIEAWDQLGFADPMIDRLLAHPKQFRTLLRRYRNVVFHYQLSLLDPRFVELLEQGAACLCWVRTLHEELIRFFAEHLAGLMVTDEQRAELREHVEAVVHWYPCREAPQLVSLERTLAYGRQVLAKYPDDHSEERQEIERGLDSAEATLREGRRNWAALRAQILREAGVE